MKIDDYIIRGGENLNDFPQKTASFPHDAEQIFNEWHSKLGKDAEEKENYFERPVNDQNRLFIRSFYVEKPGNRPICYYVGLLIPKTAYREANYYYCIHKGLCSISLAQIQNAVKASFLPIEFTTDWPIPRSPIGHDFQHLSKMRLYGDKEFSANIDQMCLGISIHCIDDWFSKLFIAVNPYRLSQDFNVVVSRKEPRPPMPDDKFITTETGQYQRQSSDRKTEDTTGFCEPSSNSKVSRKSSRITYGMVLALSVLALIVCLYHFIVCGDRVPSSSYIALQEENEKLKKANEKLSSDRSNLDRDNHDKDQKIKHLQRELDKRDAKIKELEKQYQSPMGIFGTNDFWSSAPVR